MDRKIPHFPLCLLSGSSTPPNASVCPEGGEEPGVDQYEPQIVEKYGYEVFRFERETFFGGVRTCSIRRKGVGCSITIRGMNGDCINVNGITDWKKV